MKIKALGCYILLTVLSQFFLLSLAFAEKAPRYIDPVQIGPYEWLRYYSTSTFPITQWKAEVVYLPGPNRNRVYFAIFGSDGDWHQQYLIDLEPNNCAEEVINTVPKVCWVKRGTVEVSSDNSKLFFQEVVILLRQNLPIVFK